MSTLDRYQLPLTGGPRWDLVAQTQSSFNWDYEEGRARMVTLYNKGKQQQWDGARRIDWSVELDPENPVCHAAVSIAHTMGRRMEDKARHDGNEEWNYKALQDAGGLGKWVDGGGVFDKSVIEGSM